MKILGLIVEYNPFHNGHIFHIQKSKELIKPDYTIAVMSSSFVQRGEPAIISKWTRSQQALEFGVDLVIELPFVYACQSADYFAKGAIDLLYHAGVTDICFGSECGDIQVFEEIAAAINDNEEYDQLVKLFMNKGYRYPDACNQALSQILNKEVRTPNDLLGLCYVKEIMTNHYPIHAHCIVRSNDYHSENLNTIASATSIRKALFLNQDVSFALPFSPYYAHHHLNHFDDFFPYLKYKILTSSTDELKNIHLIDEGLENRIKEQILINDNMETFVNALSSKRYTKVRIQRMIVHLLMNNQKQDIQKAMNVNYLRILASNQKGRTYLKQLKKKTSYILVSNYSSYHHPALDIEAKATSLISIINKEEELEYKHYPYIKND